MGHMNTVGRVTGTNCEGPATGAAWCTEVEALSFFSQGRHGTRLNKGWAEMGAIDRCPEEIYRMQCHTLQKESGIIHEKHISRQVTES